MRVVSDGWVSAIVVEAYY